MSSDGSISKNVGLLRQLTIRGGSLTCVRKSRGPQEHHVLQCQFLNRCYILNLDI